MNRWHGLFLAILLLGGSWIWLNRVPVALSADANAPQPAIHYPAPDFALTTLAGESFSLRAEQYADKGVQLISISDEDLETVETFLKREIEGAGDGADSPKTYRELTSAYCLTTDPDRSCETDYMKAAQQNGIPTAFIVGKSGQIEWIGHPMEMDEPLKSVVEDKWDRAAYLAEFKAQQEQQVQMQKLFTLLNRGKMDDAMTMLDEMIEKKEDVQAKMQFQMLKLQVMLQQEEKKDEVAGFAKSVLDGIAEDPMMTNQICWAFVEMTEAGRIDNPELLKTALAATATAAEAAGALLTGPGLVHDERAALQRLAVHAVDGGLGFGIRAHLHEAEALGAAGLAVHHHLGRGDGAELRKGLRERIVTHRIRQVAYVKLVSHGEPSITRKTHTNKRTCRASTQREPISFKRGV